ncbi:folate family ECF transporter S component [Candidatus Saccharibacteria bacterium]|nr:folate family ECF transporter S component [Candidatus Saccharibacteria bacterium]
MRKSLKNLVLSSLFIGIAFVLQNFLGLKLWNLKFNLSIIVFILAGFYLGPLWTVAIAMLSDVLGALLVPTGVYFFPFTLTAGLSGLLFGLLGSAFVSDVHARYPEERNAISCFSIIGTIFLNELVVTFFLNTLFISILFGVPFGSLIGPRGLQALVNCVAYPFLAILCMEIISSLEKQRLR